MCPISRRGLSSLAAHLTEAFHSWQGEGLHVGRRQLFLRFSGCNLRCAYCDTLFAYERRRDFIFHGERGERVRVDNPVSPKTLMELIDAHGEDVERSGEVSLTGGEPLLWWRFLQGFLPGLRRTGRRVMLETNGTLPEALEQIIGDVDAVAMDIKISSTAGNAPDVEVSRRFLSIASAREVFVKVVVGPRTTDAEMRQVGETVASLGKRIPVVLQPVTGANGRIGVSSRRLERLAGRLSDKLPDIRVIGQLHKFMGIR